MNIPVKWLVPAIMLVILSPIFSVLASVKIAENQAEDLQRRYIAAQAAADEKAALARQAAQEQSRMVLCRLFTEILNGYESPDLTQAGRKVRDAWLEVYRISQCTPKR